MWKLWALAPRLRDMASLLQSQQNKGAPKLWLNNSAEKIKGRLQLSTSWSLHCTKLIVNHKMVFCHIGCTNISCLVSFLVWRIQTENSNKKFLIVMKIARVYQFIVCKLRQNSKNPPNGMFSRTHHVLLTEKSFNPFGYQIGMPVFNGKSSYSIQKEQGKNRADLTSRIRNQKQKRKINCMVLKWTKRLRTQVKKAAGQELVAVRIRKAYQDYMRVQLKMQMFPTWILIVDFFCI